MLQEEYLHQKIDCDKGGSEGESAPKKIKKIENSEKLQRNCSRIRNTTRDRSTKVNLSVEVPCGDITIEDTWDKLKVKKVDSKDLSWKVERNGEGFGFIPPQMV